MTLSNELTQQVRSQLNEMADKVAVAKDGTWTITKNLTTETHDQLDGYVVRLTTVIAAIAPMTISVIEAKPKKGGAKTPSSWVVKLTLQLAEVITAEPKIDQAVREPDYDWQLFCKLAATLSGDPEAVNFKGSIRTEITDASDIDALATDYYRTLKLFCKTATCTYRLRKDGAYSITLSAGDRREAVAAA